MWSGDLFNDSEWRELPGGIQATSKLYVDPGRPVQIPPTKNVTGTKRKDAVKATLLRFLSRRLAIHSYLLKLA